MKENPTHIAARLMAPAATSAYWSFAQVEALIIQAIREERGETKPRAARKGKPDPSAIGHPYDPPKGWVGL